jgi:hypothetical protein
MVSNPPTRILLLGAGELGTAFLTHLSSVPSTHITIGVRTPSNYPNLVTHNTDLTAIDLTSPSESLAVEFSHYNVIISATGFGQGSSAVSKLAKEVLEAGRLKEGRERGGRLWFFPWQWGVDYDVTGDAEGLMPLFGEQKKVRDLLRTEAKGANVKWTVVSTGIFMSFLFEPFWSIVDRSREKEGRLVVRALRDWDHKVTVTDVQDIGRVLARIVAGDVDAENKVMYVAGDTVSYGELAEIVSRISGKAVKKESWAMEHLEEELRSNPEDGIKKYRLVFAREGVWWDKAQTVNAGLGMSMMSVKEYTRTLFGGGV